MATGKHGKKVELFQLFETKAFLFNRIYFSILTPD